MNTTKVTYIGAKRTYTDMDIWFKLALERKAGDGSLGESLGLQKGEKVKLLQEQTFDFRKDAIDATRQRLQANPKALIVFNSDGFGPETGDKIKKQKDLPLERIFVPKLSVEFPNIAAA